MVVQGPDNTQSCIKVRRQSEDIFGYEGRWEGSTLLEHVLSEDASHVIRYEQVWGPTSTIYPELRYLSIREKELCLNEWLST